MKRVIAVLASASFVVAIGCSDYDIRMGKTLEEMRYAKRLNTNLEEAPTKGTLQGDDIFVRPPKGLVGPTQAFSLTGVDPGKFDIENSFIDEKKGTSLHVVARIKKPKPPPNAKKAAAPVETVPRGKFIDDVVELVKAAYNVELAPATIQARVQVSPQSRKRLQGRKARYGDQTSRGLRLHRIKRCPRGRTDLRVSQDRAQLHEPEDRSLSGEPRRRRPRQALF